MFYSALRSSLLAVFVLTPAAVLAQNQNPPPPANTANPPPASNPNAPANEDLLKPEQLEALVSPIALYPDNLLAAVLMASTYPLEIIQADRWVNENKSLKGDALKAAVDKQPWDDTVKQLVATPAVLSMMSTKLDWTKNLGDAVLAQQPDVMDAIQRLRAKAQANNKLQSTKEQTVTVQQQQSKKVIVIQPTNPQTVYVPYYDPAVVYGAWPYPSYPPYYFGYPGYIPGALLGAGLAFGAGYALGRWAGSGGCCWGGNVTWNNNNINIGNGSGNWNHHVEHRGGVRYNNPRVDQRFNGNRPGAGGGSVQNRMDFRGRGGNQVLNPGGGGLGDRGNLGGGNRPGGGNIAGGNRPGGGARPATRPAGGGGNRGAFGGVGGGGRAANMASQRGRASFGGGGGGGLRGGGGGGGGFRGGGGGGGGRGGGGGGGGRGGGGGGRRSDINLKHDIALLGWLNNGIGYYRFSYNGSDKAYVGVMAQEVETVMPGAVVQGPDGYLRVRYGQLGLKFQTYDQWIAAGGRIPSTLRSAH